MEQQLTKSTADPQNLENLLNKIREKLHFFQQCARRRRRFF